VDNLRSIWKRLDTTRRALAVLAVLAVVVAVLGLARMTAAPGMSLLYAGLDGRQAGEIVQVLEQEGTRYEVRGDAIFVPAPERDRLRMTLAGQGLPATTGAGYELLDSLTGFGTTSQMFDAAYWRAKEGELARTVLSSGEVREARVHIANPEAGPFRSTGPTTASIAVTTRGGTLSEGRAEAFRHLVASAVRGLDPADVAVIDANTGRVVASGDGAPGGADPADRAAAIKARVERLLAARMGPGRAVVEASVETVRETESIVERRIDPESRVAISTDVEEIARSQSGSGGNGVTVASNLPDGDAAADGSQSRSQNSESRALTNYDLSETTRQVERAPGAIRRLTVAVLLDSAALAGGGGDAGQDGPGDGELADLRALVADTVGYDEARGDRITVKAMPFAPAEPKGTAAGTGLLDRFGVPALRLVQLGVLAAVALVLGLFVVRPILRGSAPPELAGASGRLLDAEATAATRLDANATGAEPEPSMRTIEASAPEGLPAPDIQGGAGGAAAGVNVDGDAASPVAELKQLIEQRQPDTIEILRTWLEDDRVEEPS